MHVLQAVMCVTIYFTCIAVLIRLNITGTTAVWKPKVIAKTANMTMFVMMSLAAADCSTFLLLRWDGMLIIFPLTSRHSSLNKWTDNIWGKGRRWQSIRTITNLNTTKPKQWNLPKLTQFSCFFTTGGSIPTWNHSRQTHTERMYPSGCRSTTPHAVVRTLIVYICICCVGWCIDACCWFTQNSFPLVGFESMNHDV